MSERDELRQIMRSTLANCASARAEGHLGKLAALVELAKAMYGLHAFHARRDPIITATLAMVIADDCEAKNLYAEALQQNKSFPDERSYEWRLNLANRFLPTGDIPHAGTELRECRGQAADAGDHQAVLRADALLANLPTPGKRAQVYTDGTELHAGHRITYNGQPGTVVFVIEHHEYSPGFASTAWEDLKTGFMIRFDNGAMLHFDRADQHLVRAPDEGVCGLT